MNEHLPSPRDICVGQTFRTAEYRLTSEAIKKFAGEYDPQPMHLDESAAAAGPFGQLVASGWHTLAATMRLVVKAKPFGETPFVGVGVDNIKFARPVFADTALYVVATVTHKRQSASRPQRWFIKLSLETKAAGSGEVLLSQDWTVMMSTSRDR